MTDWGMLYRDNAEAVAALAGGLDDDELAVVVPATPAWTVRQMLAHLAGGPADALADRMDGAPGPEWTARHVAAREGRAVPELTDELRGNEDGVAASVADSPRPALVWDIAVHHADLLEALGRPRLDERLWAPIVPALGPSMAPGLMGAVPDYEVFRALFSRRSRAQMREWGTGLDDDQLAAVCIFGPRDDDQPVPD